MKTWLRFIMALLSAFSAWFIYINLAKYLLVADELREGLSIISFYNFGDVPLMVRYIESMGWLIVGTNFAHTFAPKGSAIKAVWQLVKAIFKICFWSLFIYTEFNYIGVTGEYGTIELFLDIDITLFFYALIGGVIFQLIISILDFLIAFIPEKPDKKQIAKIQSNNPPAPKVEGGN